jgi:hypothetical protein
MTEVRAVGLEEFQVAILPMVSAIRDLAGAVTSNRDRHGQLPDAGSLAMRELSDEADYARRSGLDAPITLVHTLGDLTVTAASDYVRSFGNSFTTETVPLYGHLVLARAALESCVISGWLNEPGIARDERVKRGLSEYIYSASEEVNLKLDPNARTHLRGWIANATNLGWAVTDRDGDVWSRNSTGKPQVDGVTRPSTAAGIRSLLVEDETSKIGRLEWNRLSAVIHVTFFGLRWALALEDGVRNPLTGLVTVPAMTTSAPVMLQAVCILKALRVAAGARFELMGWLDDEWNAAARASNEYEHATLQFIQATHPQQVVGAEDAEQATDESD